MNNRYYRVVRNINEPDYVWIRNDSTETSILSVPGGCYKDVEYSYDKIEWNTFRINNSVEIPPKQKLYLRCTDVPYEYISAENGSSGINHNMSFNFKKECTFGGDIRTLIDYKTLPTIIPRHHFYFTFSGCPLAKSIPDCTYIVVDEGGDIFDMTYNNSKQFVSKSDALNSSISNMHDSIEKISAQNQILNESSNKLNVLIQQ